MRENATSDSLTWSYSYLPNLSTFDPAVTADIGAAMENVPSSLDGRHDQYGYLDGDDGALFGHWTNE